MRTLILHGFGISIKILDKKLVITNGKDRLYPNNHYTSDTPSNLEVNCGKGNRFHLDTLTSGSCTDDPSIEPNPPPAGFDTYVGTGTGTVNGEPGHTIEFTFTDAGEPGTADFAYIVIDGGATLSVSGNLKNGNQQAHET